MRSCVVRRVFEALFDVLIVQMSPVILQVQRFSWRGIMPDNLFLSRPDIGFAANDETAKRLIS